MQRIHENYIRERVEDRVVSSAEGAALGPVVEGGMSQLCRGTGGG